MASIPEIEAEIIDEFSWFDDPMDKYEYIIELGNKLPVLSEEHKTETNIVKGCQSKVWLMAYPKDGLIHFEADSNTVITKGIIALLIRVLSDRSSKEILDYNLDFIDKIDLRSHLTSQRSNGLTAMINKMRWYAEVFNVKE